MWPFNNATKVDLCNAQFFILYFYFFLQQRLRYTGQLLNLGLLLSLTKTSNFSCCTFKLHNAMIAYNGAKDDCHRRCVLCLTEFVRMMTAKWTLFHSHHLTGLIIRTVLLFPAFFSLTSFPTGNLCKYSNVLRIWLACYMPHVQYALYHWQCVALSQCNLSVTTLGTCA